MKHHNFTLLLCLLLLTAGTHCKAQQKPGDSNRKSQVQPAGSNGVWQVFDSLADVHLFLGDTLQAIIYFQKSVELNPSNKEGSKSLQKLRRQYSKTASSFYLKDR